MIGAVMAVAGFVWGRLLPFLSLEEQFFRSLKAGPGVLILAEPRRVRASTRWARGRPRAGKTESTG